MQRSNAAVMMLLGTIFFATALSASFLHDRLPIMSDSLVYLQGARSLQSGAGYVADSGDPIIIWPPGYSLLLSVIPGATRRVVIAKGINVVFSLIAILGIYVFFRKRLSLTSASLLGCAVVTFFPWLYYTHTVLSDIVFASIFVLFSICIVRYMQCCACRDVMLASLLVGFGTLLRSAGVVLIFSFGLAILVVLCLCIRKASITWRVWVLAGVGLMVAVLPTILFMLRNRALTGSFTGYDMGAAGYYTASLERAGIVDRGLLTRVWVNVRGYLHIFVFPDQGGIARIGALPWYARMIAIFPWGMGILGMGSALRRREGWYDTVILAPLVGILLLNNWYDIRYMLPVLPWFVFYVLHGLFIVGSWGMQALARVFPNERKNGHSWVWSCFQKYFYSTALLVIIGLNVTMLFATQQGRKLRSSAEDTPVQHLQEAVAFVDGYSPGSPILALGATGFLRHWYSGQVIDVRANADGYIAVDDIPVPYGYLILSDVEFMPNRARLLEPLVARNPELFEEKFRLGQTVVYRFVRSEE